MKITGKHIEMLAEEWIKDLIKKPMPVYIAYGISRAIETLRQESEAYLKAKQVIVDKYKEEGAGPDEDGNIKIANMMEFMKDFMELQAQEIELNIDKVDVQLNDLPALSISEMDFIRPFLNIKEK